MKIAKIHASCIAICTWLVLSFSLKTMIKNNTHNNKDNNNDNNKDNNNDRLISDKKKLPKE